MIVLQTNSKKVDSNDLLHLRFFVSSSPDLFLRSRSKAVPIYFYSLVAVSKSILQKKDKRTISVAGIGVRTYDLPHPRSRTLDCSALDRSATTDRLFFFFLMLALLRRTSFCWTPSKSCIIAFVYLWRNEKQASLLQLFTCDVSGSVSVVLVHQPGTSSIEPEII